MSEIIRNRIIRPSTRLERSKSYKIDTKNVSSSDKLIVNINHESKSFKETYTFSGADISYKDSISFRVVDYGDRIDISWSGANPVSKSPTKSLVSRVKLRTKKNVLKKEIKVSDLKMFSLEPIANYDSKVLICGTMPGEDLLRKQQYYAHSRNLFWKLLGGVIGKDFPHDYNDKKQLLLNNGIALWDVCYSCVREGSLDSNIMDEAPNDLSGFIETHPNIKAIAFNGQKAAKLFAKYFGSIVNVRVMVLPSTSPANAGVSMEEKVKQWGKVKQYF